MTIYHIVLFKLKQGVTPAQITEMKTAGQAMVGQIPGLKSFRMGPNVGATSSIVADRAQGFNMGIMTVMDTEEQVAAYATHPAHLVVHKIRESLCEDTLAYDMVVDDE